MKRKLVKIMTTLFMSCMLVFSLTVNAYAVDVVQNRFYSEYAPTKFNSGSTPANGSTTDHIQYRMNCYGYAFGYVLYGSTTYSNIYGGYKQQPGEFARTADKPNTVGNIVANNPTATMTNVVSNMSLDATRLGYSMTEYTTTSSTVAQYGTSSRLIAVVTGASDYHFYIQHSDSTWSHKPGSGAVTDKSLGDNTTLTNTNIKAKANQGAYANGQLKFFVITKDAVIDYPYGTRCCLSWPCAHTQNTSYTTEKAGEYPITSSNKSIGSTSARIDFAKDYDVYCFTASTTKTYAITTTCTTGADLDCRIYNSEGTLVKTDVAIGQVNTTYAMTAGKKYYIEIRNYSETQTNYTISIS